MPSPAISLFRKYGTAAIATAACAAVFFAMQPRQLSAAERQEVARAFQFERLALPEPAGSQTKQIRQVHPSLQRIAAWVSATGAAVALSDLDGDGKSNDIVQVDPRTDEVSVYPAPSTGTRFERFTLTPNAGVRYDANTMAPMGSLVTDINEDGAPDIVVYYWGRTPIAFINSGKPSDKPTATAFRAKELVPGNEIWNTGCGVVADFDGDGHQDLLFCNYFPDGAEVLNPEGTGVVQMQDSISHAFNGGKKHLLLCKPGTTSDTTTFIEAKNLFPDEVNGGWTVAVGAMDLDGDMLPEIYFANDTGPDRLLHNESKKGAPRFSLAEGQGGFTVPTSFVLGQDSFKGMGCDFADINHDGIPDIYVSNIACPFGLQESHYLWLSNSNRNKLNQNIAPYSQASEALGLSRSGWGWDCRLADFNNDGVFEGVQATGFLKGKINRWPELQSLSISNNIVTKDPRNWPGFKLGDDISGHEKNAFFVRAQDGRYYNCNEDVGVADDTVSRGISIGDIDADGKLDFVVANQWEPSYLFRNALSSQQKFLALKLLLPVNASGKTEIVDHAGATRPAAPAIPAIGATATVHTPNGTILSSTVDGGSGHSGKRAQDIHFGLGELPEHTKLAVDLTWRTRNGEIQRRTVHLKPGWHTIELYGGGQTNDSSAS